MSTETPSRRRGVAVLEDPLLNKGTAFSATERDELGLGL
jgi:malate dehydrogenase (oxaloacetate-decarboxylating)